MPMESFTRQRSVLPLEGNGGPFLSSFTSGASFPPQERLDALWATRYPGGLECVESLPPRKKADGYAKNKHLYLVMDRSSWMDDATARRQQQQSERPDKPL